MDSDEILEIHFKFEIISCLVEWGNTHQQAEPTPWKSTLKFGILRGPIQFLAKNGEIKVLFNGFHRRTNKFICLFRAHF
jgi:hypothetical protein